MRAIQPSFIIIKEPLKRLTFSLKRQTRTNLQYDLNKLDFRTGYKVHCNLLNQLYEMNFVKWNAINPVHFPSPLIVKPWSPLPNSKPKELGLPTYLLGASTHSTFNHEEEL